MNLIQDLAIFKRERPLLLEPSAHPPLPSRLRWASIFERSTRRSKCQRARTRAPSASQISDRKPAHALPFCRRARRGSLSEETARAAWMLPGRRANEHEPMDFGLFHHGVRCSSRRGACVRRVITRFLP